MPGILDYLGGWLNPLKKAAAGVDAPQPNTPQPAQAGMSTGDIAAQAQAQADAERKRKAAQAAPPPGPPFDKPKRYNSLGDKSGGSQF